MADDRTIRYSDWGVFDPRRLDARIEIDAAGVDFDTTYTWQVEHAGTLYQFLGCRPKPGARGKAAFNLAEAGVIVSGPLGWTGGPLWPQDREDQPPRG